MLQAWQITEHLLHSFELRHKKNFMLLLHSRYHCTLASDNYNLVWILFLDMIIMSRFPRCSFSRENLRGLLPKLNIENKLDSRYGPCTRFFLFLPPTKLRWGNVLTRLCLSIHSGCQCDHYPWCIGTPCTALLNMGPQDPQAPTLC